MAEFDDLYRMQQAMNNPMINVQQQQVRMPNWLTPPRPPDNNLGGTQLLLDQMNRFGEVDRRQQALDIQRQRNQDLADIQMRTFMAKQEQTQKAQEAREAYAESSPEFAEAILAGEDPSDFQRKMASVGGDPAKYREVYGPGAGTQVDVNLPGKEFGKELGVQIAKDMIKERLPQARKAVAGLQTVREARNLLDEGAFTGKFGPAQLAFGAALQDIGIDYGGDAVANTQAYTAAMGREVGDLVTMFGAGTGLSDADREFAKQMAGGDIAITEKALRKILDLNERARRNALKQYNKDAKSVMESEYGQSLPFDITVEYPEIEESPTMGESGIDVDQSAIEAEMARRGL